MSKDLLLKSIPTFFRRYKAYFACLALVIIVYGAIAGYNFTVKSNSSPENITASTFSPNGFTISWFTKDKSTALLEVSKTEDFKSVVKFSDIRDYAADGKENFALKRISHVLVAKDLEPQTKYYYRIKVDGNITENNDIYNVTTPEVSDDVNTPEPLYGEVLNQDNKPQSNVIVTAQAIQANQTKSSIITTYSAENGTYSLDLSNLRSPDLKTPWKQEKGIPTFIRVTASTDSESYYYDIHDGKYSPAETFIFKGVDNGYAQKENKSTPLSKLISNVYAQSQACADAKAQCDGASKCNPDDPTYGDACRRQKDDCSTNTKRCEDSKKNTGGSGGGNNNTAGLNACEAAKKAKENCKYFIDTNPEAKANNSCGWEKDIASAEATCKAQGGTVPDLDKPGKNACEFLYDDFSAAKDCEGRNAAKAKWGAKCNEAAGKNDENNTKADSCVPNAIGSGDTVDGNEEDNKCFTDATSKNKYKCDPNKPGYAIAVDNSCTNATHTYCNGACGDATKCLAEHKSSQPKQGQTTKPGNTTTGGGTAGNTKTCAVSGTGNSRKCVITINGVAQSPVTGANVQCGGQGQNVSCINPSSNPGVNPGPQTTRCNGSQTDPDSCQCDTFNGEERYKNGNGKMMCRKVQVGPGTPKCDFSALQCKHNKIIGSNLCVDSAPGNSNGDPAWCCPAGEEVVKNSAGSLSCAKPAPKGNSTCLGIDGAPFKDSDGDCTCPSDVPFKVRISGGFYCTKTDPSKTPSKECDGKTTYVDDQCSCKTGYTPHRVGGLDRRPLECTSTSSTLKDDDMPCSNASQCKSNLCNPNHSRQNRCGVKPPTTTTNVAAPKKDDGMPCSTADQCKSNLCNQNASRQNRCGVKPRGGNNGSTNKSSFVNSIKGIFIKDVKAQESSLTEDTKAKLEVKSSGVLTAGKYDLSDGRTLNLISPTLIKFYDDANGNGLKDDTESYVEDEIYTVTKIAEGFSYPLVNGWNAVNFPMYQSDKTFYKASDIRAIAAAQGIGISAIKKWEGKWIEYVVDGGGTFGEDFIIKPNEGYFIRTHSAGTLTMFGSAPTSTIPMQFLNGWSLIGSAPGYFADGTQNYSNKEFKDGITAFEFIKTVNNFDKEIKMSNITEYKSGLYNGANITNQGKDQNKEFGNNFAINELSAYFVKSEKKTVFTP